MSATIQTATETSYRLPIWRQIRWVMVITFVFIALAPVSIIAGISISRAVQEVETQVLSKLESVAELKHASIDRWLIDSQSVLELFASGPRESRLMLVANLDQESEAYASEIAVFQNLLKSSMETQSLLTEIFVYTPEGNLFLSSDETQIGRDIANEPYFQNSLIGNSYVYEVLGQEISASQIDYIQPPYFDQNDEMTMVITHALLDDLTGEIEVIVAGRLNMAILNELMLERAGLGDTGETYLVNLDNSIMLTESRFEGNDYQFNTQTSEGITRALAGADGRGAYDDYRGVPILGVYRWVPEIQAALLAEQDTAEALASALQSRNITLVVSGITAVIAITLGLLVSNYIANPIINLARVAGQVERGHLDQRVDVKQRNEVGLLATAFNSMTGQLQEFISGLESRVAERTRALQISSEISRSLSTILDKDELTQAVVAQVREAYDYYHAQIYLWDETQTRLVMVGGTGQAGRQMLAAGHGIERGRGLVGKCAETNLPVLVADVSADPSWLPNPLLPETKSETAVPIALGSNVLGVLDVQHTKTNGLSQQDVDMLVSIANQVAIGLQNTAFYATTQAKAQQEALINEINQKILQTTDIESALKVAVREVGRAVSASQTAVRLAHPTHSNGNGHGD